MSTVDPSLLNQLRDRNLVTQMTGGDELESYLKSESRTLYCGFDPTANSLHIGSLVPLLALRRFQLAGHKPIALVGGATGLIGDPSFKSQERSLNDEATVGNWVECLKKQISVFIDFNGERGSIESNQAIMANNLDWTQGMDVLTFLRDVGKHFSINNMINKESVKQRIDREGEGISYTEFTYMILQSYDFAELYKRHNCTLQIGGSDQWGNITGGVDLVRRLHGGTAYGLTFPLVTKADGTKFGKTESGTIWLDPERTSPYAFYQFWLNSADADVYNFMRYFTFLDVPQLIEIENSDKTSNTKPEAQGILAKEATELVHGKEGLEAAQRITEALFSNKLQRLSETDLAQLKLDGLPSTTLSPADLVDKPLTQLLSDSGVVNSGKQVKDALSNQSVFINERALSKEDNMRTAECFNAESAYFGRYFVLKLGKKKYHLFDLKN